MSFSAADFLDEAQLSTAGTLVEAVSFGSTNSATLNGVAFSGTTSAGGHLSVQSVVYNSYNVDHFRDAIHSITGVDAAEGNALFDGLAYGSGVGSNLVALSGLTVGAAYEIQLLIVDDRTNNSIPDKTVTVSQADGGAPDTGALDHSSNRVQIVTGTFIADNTSQSFDIAINVGNNTQLNAYQIRSVPTSDPSLVTANPHQFTHDGTPETLLVPFSNGGATHTLIISDPIQVSGPDAGFFSVSGYDNNLGPGVSGDISLAFDPNLPDGGARAYSITLTILSNDENSPKTIEVQVSPSGGTGDLDGDTLPDQWEIENGLDPTDDGSIDPDNGPEGDPDGDGLPNSEEFHLSVTSGGWSGTTTYDPQVNDFIGSFDYHTWGPRPRKAHLLTVGAHCDDEGIFFGGLIPYATQVLRLNVVHLAMNSDIATRPPNQREGELRNACWQYGMHNQPIFARFASGDPADGGISSSGGDLFIARQIRRYRPDVVATHGREGEYGHADHQATAAAAIAAIALAADPCVVIDGLPSWQVRKLYLHFDNASDMNGKRLFHDYWEDAIINDGEVMKTPRQVANEGLVFETTPIHEVAVSTVYEQGELYAGWDGYHAEEWALYASTVGPDTRVDAGFTAGPKNYGTTWALGDFFENLTVFPDGDSDGLPDDWELAHFPSLAAADPAADPAADDDADGLDTTAEFVAGLDPHAPDRIQIGISAATDAVDFTIPAATGPGYDGLNRRYRLYYSPDLESWSTLVAEGIADGSSLSYTIGSQGESGDRGFYRLALSIE